MTENTQDAATDLLIQEVDEELRQEQLQKVWKKYGNLLVGGALSLVVAVAGWQAYSGWKTKTRQALSAEYSLALQDLDQGKTHEADAILAKLSVDSATGYRQLAAMKQADLRQKAGDAAAAAALYDSVATNSGSDRLIAELARLKSAYLKVDSADPASMEKDIQPLTAESSPWRHSARELMALLAMRRADTAKAQEWYAKVADDGGAPTAIRTRATEMLAALSAKPSH